MIPAERFTTAELYARVPTSERHHLTRFIAECGLASGFSVEDVAMAKVELLWEICRDRAEVPARRAA